MDVTIDEFYEYFRDLNEVHTLNGLLKNKSLPDPKEVADVQARVKVLNSSMQKFRSKVYANLKQRDKLHKSEGIKINLFCTNKKCKHKFNAIKHEYLRIVYNCPKCKSQVIEVL